MPDDLLYREAPERAAQKAQDGIDTSDRNTKMVSKLIFSKIINYIFHIKLLVIPH